MTCPPHHTVPSLSPRVLLVRAGYDYQTLAPEWMRGETGVRYTGQVGFEFLRIVAQMLVLGLLLGWLFGFVTVFFLKRLINLRSARAAGSEQIATFLSCPSPPRDPPP